MKKSASLMTLGVVLAACSGSAASDEELRAAELIHSAKDKMVIKGLGTVDQETASPAKFSVTTPVAKGDFLTVTKLGKCKYESYFDARMLGGPVFRVTVDLNGLSGDMSQAKRAPTGYRMLKGASVACELVRRPEDKSAINNICEMMGPETVPVIGDSSEEELSALSATFKADFCP